MAYDQALAERVRELLADEPGLTSRKMFGGYVYFLDGNMCAGLERDRLITRVPADQYQDALAQPSAAPFPNLQRPMKNWVAVEAEGIAEDEDVKRWVASGIAVARSLPPK